MEVLKGIERPVKLKPDVAALSADRFADATFPYSFRYRHQYDVQNSNPFNEESDRGDNTQNNLDVQAYLTSAPRPFLH